MEHLKILDIENVRPCRVLTRLNRFVVRIECEGTLSLAHITNTGRLQEYLGRKKRGYCFPTPGTGKTEYRLFAVEDQNQAALIDTQYQMKAFEEASARNLIPWLDGFTIMKKNIRLGESLIDYFLKKEKEKLIIEVKSAAMRSGSTAMYPDCPAERGRRHVRELTEYAFKGGRAAVLFQAALPGIRNFTPFRKADEELYRLLVQAKKSGVIIRCMGIFFSPKDSTIRLYNPNLPVILKR